MKWFKKNENLRFLKNKIKTLRVSLVIIMKYNVSQKVQFFKFYSLILTYIAILLEDKI